MFLALTNKIEECSEQEVRDFRLQSVLLELYFSQMLFQSLYFIHILIRLLILNIIITTFSIVSNENDQTHLLICVYSSLCATMA